MHFMKRFVYPFFMIVLMGFVGCNKRHAGPEVEERRTVFVVDKSYLKPYKEQCEAEHGIFCAKEVRDTFVSATPYGNDLSTTEYLLTCKKPQHTPSKPECVIIK